MENEREVGQAEGFILGTILGAILGSIVSLLLAPKSGKDLREDIRKSTDDTLYQMDEYLETARERGSEIAEDVEDAASEYLNLASGKVDEAVSKTKSMFKDASEEVDETIEDLADKFSE